MEVLEIKTSQEIGVIELSRGPKGDVGETGPQGPQGTKGDKGDTGSQGPQGVQGATGPANTLSVGTVAGGDEAGATITGSAPTQTLNLTLPKGDKGDTGAAGPQGPQGLQGTQGIQGNAGPQGSQGPQGATGPQGEQGLKGDKGDKGDTGAQGLKGDKGDKGDTGSQGIQGEQGIQGATGATGATGPTGATGATGPKGDKGDTGNTGPQGAEGPQGIQGIQGATGPIGLDWHSAWSNEHAYVVTDAVSYLGSSWRCIQNHTNQTPTEGAYWTIIAQKGSDGQGAGDMLKSTYDSNDDGKFSADIIVDGTTNKVYTATEQSKLSGIAAGAEVNVNADWDSSSGDSQILNKPTIPTLYTDSLARTACVATTITNGVTTSAPNQDAVFDALAGKSDTGHSHTNDHVAATVADSTSIDMSITGQQISAAAIFGTTSGTVCQGNDGRLSDARTPASHAHGNITNAGLVGSTANIPLITGTGGVVQAGSFGTAAATFCVGNDARLSDARTPSNHNLVDTTKHPVSGLTAGHFLKATSENAYGFAAHGLTAASVSALPTAGGTMSGAIDMGTQALHSLLGAAFETQYAITTTTGNITLAWNNSYVQRQNEPTGNITYTFTAPTNSPCHLQLNIYSDGTSTARSFTWPSTVKWLGVAWAAVANKNAYINFWYDGTSYWAQGVNEA